MKPDTFRDRLDAAPTDLDPGGIVVGLVATVVLWVLAPVLVVVLAVLLLSVEVPLLLILGVLILLVRFAGVVPWTVVTLDPVTDRETSESFRFLPSAVRRIRETNHDRRVRVRWAWS